MSNSTSKRRKVLIPLASLLAAGAIAVGSGASFTSTSSIGESSMTTGTLSQTNNAEGQSINLTNLKPGDSISSPITVTNSGTLPATFKLVEDASNPFGNYLNLKVMDGTTTVYNGALGKLGTVSLPGSGTDGVWAAPEAHTYTFTATLSGNTPNESTDGTTYQGQKATEQFTWDSTQTTGTPTINQTGKAN